MRYTYTYDAMGRLTRKQASGRTLLSLSYDLNGNLTRQEDLTGKVTEYRYNQLEQVSEVWDSGKQVASYTYYPDGQRKSLKNGDSLYTQYAYDGDRNLTHLKTLLGEEVLVDNHYRYDGNGNRTEKKQLSGITRYAYDALKRLSRAEYPDYTEELFYDQAGNRVRRVVKEGAGAQRRAWEETYCYDSRNRLTERRGEGGTERYTYDEAGNLLRDGRATYTYDAFHRTVKVETFHGEIQINRYDAEGLRAEMEENGQLVQFIYRDREIVVEERAEEKVRYIRADQLLASDAQHAKTWYHYASDELGSITHVEQKGQVLNRYEYDAWGNLTVSEEQVENRFKFTGQQLDPISQQYYLRARYYNPVIGRFTQEDTYYEDGLNLYAYCRNNPVYYVDPSGNFCDNAAERICHLIDEGRIKGQNRAKLESYLRENAGNLTDAEKRVAERLGVDVESKQGFEVDPNTRGYVTYGGLDQLGRATGIEAVITADMIMTGSEPSQSIRPTGFRGREAGHARGHLLARQLGGTGRDARNLVTIYQNPVNNPNMSSLERRVRNAVERGQVVNYRVTPIYRGNELIPCGITIEAQGNQGLYISETILNRR